MSQTLTETTMLEEISSKRLGKASAQDIQLELIRRRQFNAFDGERIAELLMQHRDLWEAVMMDRIAVSNPGHLPALGLVKLRDLFHNDWNADTLYVLTPNPESAEQLAEAFRQTDCGGLVDVHTEPEEIDSALGGAQPGHAVVAVWWE